MNAIPPEFPGLNHTMRDTGDRLAARWSALAGAAQVVAGLAQARDVEAALRPPFTLDRAGGGRRVLVDQALDDMLAMMEPGLTALLAVHQRGGATGPAAMALWQEFLRARRGLLGLAPIGLVTR
jgi:hypothetical protein